MNSSLLLFYFIFIFAAFILVVVVDKVGLGLLLILQGGQVGVTVDVLRPLALRDAGNVRCRRQKVVKGNLQKRKRVREK